MGILWLIIKIILFVLLALLGLILLGLFVILVSPISYEAYLEKYNELTYDIKFTYLGIIRGHFCLEKGCKNHEVRILSKVLYEDKVEEKKKVIKQKTSEKDAVKESTVQCANKKKVKKQDLENKQQGDHQEKMKDTVKKIDTPVAEGAQEIAEDTLEEAKEETKSFAKNLDWHQIRELLFTKDFWQFVKEILRLIKSILKYILPRKWSYELVIGKEDPADTGELITKITMLYPLYYKHGIIRGDFEKSGVWGGFLAKGRFNILGILNRIIIFGLRPIVRKYIKLILEIRKEEKYGE